MFVVISWEAAPKPYKKRGSVEELLIKNRSTVDEMCVRENLMDGAS